MKPARKQPARPKKPARGPAGPRYSVMFLWPKSPQIPPRSYEVEELYPREALLQVLQNDRHSPAEKGHPWDLLVLHKRDFGHSATYQGPEGCMAIVSRVGP